MLGNVDVIGVSHGDERALEAARLAVLMTLADSCRPVVVDMTTLPGSPSSTALSRLGGLGALAWQWPATPIAVACPSAQVRTAVQRLPSGEHLAVTASLHEALTILTGLPEQVSVELRLAPHPTAPRAARDFVSRTFLDWGVARNIPGACLVASELVTNAMVHARTNLTLSLTHADRRLRIAVRDASSDEPRPRRPHPERRGGRGLQIVGSVARSWGVLPTRDGGKVVWAVTD